MEPGSLNDGGRVSRAHNSQSRKKIHYQQDSWASTHRRGLLDPRVGLLDITKPFWSMLYWL